LAARLLRYFILFFQVVRHKNNNNLPFSIILNNEAIVLESFIQIFGMAAGAHTHTHI
jgi:hypothetical protein